MAHTNATTKEQPLPTDWRLTLVPNAKPLPSPLPWCVMHGLSRTIITTTILHDTRSPPNPSANRHTTYFGHARRLTQCPDVADEIRGYRKVEGPSKEEDAVDQLGECHALRPRRGLVAEAPVQPLKDVMPRAKTELVGRSVGG